MQNKKKSKYNIINLICNNVKIHIIFQKKFLFKKNKK